MMKLVNLIGNHISMIINDPGWVPFCGPDGALSQGYDYFAPPWKNKDGNYDLIFIAWNEDGIICEVSGQGEHYKEVIA